MTHSNPQDYRIEEGPMGPIGEGQALILRVNRSCPWNHCLFCSVYKGKQFSRRSVEEIRTDIGTVRRIGDLLGETSLRVEMNGRIERQVVREAVISHPDIYGKYPDQVTPEQCQALQSLDNVSNWMMHGAKRVFFQDANALIMKPVELAEVLQYLREVFPTVETITCYARSKTCERRSVEELTRLREAGLSWCFVGIESGCDAVLSFLKKGVSMREHIIGGQKLMAAGINVAAFVMPGLAGNDPNMSGKHISDTLTVLNEVRPTEVRVRSLAVLKGTPLDDKWKSGEFLAPTEGQMIEELRILIEGLRFECTFETLQMTNPLFNVKSILSQIKALMVERIVWYQGLSSLERARFIFQRYVYGGYLDYVRTRGEYGSELGELITDAEASLEEGSGDALEKAECAVFAIKSRGIP